LDKTINRLLSFDIKHISAYSLIFEEGTPLFTNYLKGKVLPKNEDEDFELYQTIQSKLISNGFIQYEISNFAKPGYKSIHNLAYWQHKEYYGFGPSAHSFFNNKRQWNVRSLQQYLKMVTESKLPIQGSEFITKEKKLIEKIMLGLRSEGISLQDFKSEFGVHLQNECKEIVQQWIDSNKAIFENGWLKLTSEGYFICDQLTLDLIGKIEEYVEGPKKKNLTFRLQV
jgi:oxygen-independent coproporphyrinogen-3 oxidase